MRPCSRYQGNTGDFTKKGYKSDEEKAKHAAAKRLFAHEFYHLSSILYTGAAVINYQYYLKKQRQNCGSSINRKIFALRSYGNFLKLYDLPCADALPFYDVLKIRQGYRKRPSALTPQQISLLFKSIDTDTILGIRDYAICALMYQLGLRVGEVHALNLVNLDFDKHQITVIGKGNKPRTLHMNNELIEILCQYLAMRDRFCNSWLTPALFVSKKGNRLAIRTMEDNFKKILLYSSLSVPFNVTCHTLRHSMASHLNDKDVVHGGFAAVNRGA